MQSFEAVRESVLADGRIDASEAATLSKLVFADGRVDQAEADLLIDLNNQVSGADNDPSWTALYVKALCSFLLEDADSPGEIDEKEATWLLAALQSDGKIDTTESALLSALKNKAVRMPLELSEFIHANAPSDEKN